MSADNQKNSTDQKRQVYEEIDLGRHGVVEASAGTGKTYTIEHLVVRILADRFFEKSETDTIDNILLVTFTEKAAGELRDRVRQKLTAEAKNQENKKEFNEFLLKNATLVDGAPIQTIHAFCKSLLDRYPFETDMVMGQQVENSNKSLERVWRRMLDQNDSVIRDCRDTMEWLNKVEEIEEVETAEALEDVEGETKEEKEIGAAEKKSMRNWFSKLFFAIPEIVAEYNPRTDRLSNYEELFSMFNARGVELQTKIEKIGNTLAQALPKEFLFEDPKLKSGWIRFLSKLEKGTYNPDIKSPPTSGEHKALIAFWDKQFLEQPEKTERQQLYLAQAKDFKAELSNLKEVTKNDLAQIKRDNESDLAETKEEKVFAFYVTATELLIRTIERCHALWMEEKKVAGEVSFDDMIRLVRESIEKPNSPLLLQLQKQFRYGIIDEFQDTNSDQWAIFKKIFVDNNSPNSQGEFSRCVYLVGDPKQSIYKFQGADVGTYLVARETLLERSGLEEPYRLKSNFRSTSKVIHNANTLFGYGFSEEEENVKDWFLSESSCLIQKKSDVAVKAGIEKKFEGDDGIVFFKCVDVGEYARKIALTIDELVGASSFDKSSSTATLRYGDFAVLVKSHANGIPVMRALRQRGIPVAKYKDGGIFSSLEALHWIALLEAIDGKEKSDRLISKAVLTHFFGFSLEELSHFSRLEDPRAIYPLFAEWSRMAQKRRWADLLLHIWESTALEERLQQQDGGDDQLSRLLQLSNYSLDQLEEGVGGLRELILHLRALYSGKLRTAEGADLVAKANEKSAVQVMTIHASKGLEFPVVFCVTGHTSPSSKTPYLWAMYDQNERGNQSENSPAFSRHLILQKKWGADKVKRQEDEENRRLYYVAITRARQLCFLPIWINERGEPRSTFPTEFFARWDDYRRRKADEAAQKKEALALTEELKTAKHQLEEKGPPLPSRIPPLGQYPALPRTQGVPRVESWQNRWWRLTSYSGLLKSAKAAAPDEKENKGDDAPLLDPVEPPPKRRYGDSYTALPRSNTTGNALHELFETVDWGQLASGVLDQHGQQQLHTIAKKHGVVDLLNSEKQDLQLSELLQMGQLTVATPLLVEGRAASQPLHQLFDKRMAEAEFYFTFDQHGGLFTKEEKENTAGFVKGFIDLVYHYRTDSGGWKMGVLDWKSNSLPTYDSDSLHQAMIDHGYDKQALLYTVALNKLLQSRLGSQYSPSENLGAPIYLFSRGCDGESVNSGAWIPSGSQREFYRSIPEIEEKASEILDSSYLGELFRSNNTPEVS